MLRLCLDLNIWVAAASSYELYEEAAAIVNVSSIEYYQNVIHPIIDDRDRVAHDRVMAQM